MKYFIIFVLLLDHLIILPLIIRFIKKNKEYAKYKTLSSDCIRYIEMLIETVYTYKHQPQHLCDHLIQTIKKLLSYHIIDEDCSHLFPSDLKCRKNDMLLYKLHMMGFTAKELCLLFELNNINSVYVKCHRIKKKLNSDRNLHDDEDSKN